MKRMKILRQISGAAGIFFPIGVPPKGTCNFATETCLVKCIALKDKGGDNKIRVSQQVKKNIHNFFVTKSTMEVCFKIVEEMGKMQTNILHWFMSGDCLPENEKKIIDIIETLWKNTNIVQIGFTRNISFWNDIKCKSNIILTCETKNSIPARDNPRELFGVPNYENGVVELYIVNETKGATRYGGCGNKFMDSNYNGVRIKDEHPVDCAQCLKLKRGCFYKQTIRKGELSKREKIKRKKECKEKYDRDWERDRWEAEYNRGLDCS